MYKYIVVCTQNKFMGRKKLKKSEQVIHLITYVKRKHHARIMEVVEKEVDKIKLEELLEKTNKELK